MCLHVLESHESLVTTCAFSEDTSLFLTGALDKTVLIWKLPDQLVSQSILIDRLRNNKKKDVALQNIVYIISYETVVGRSFSTLLDFARAISSKIVDWAVDDVSKWLVEVELGDLVRSVQALSISGRMLLRIPDEVIIAKLQFNHDHEALEMLRKQLYWLKREDCNAQIIAEDTEIPDDFLCPITHEIMREPVQCSDGFTYERAAINEWFLCGKFTSPMTNEPLKTTSLTPNVALRNAIFTLLHGEGPSA